MTIQFVRRSRETLTGLVQPKTKERYIRITTRPIILALVVVLLCGYHEVVFQTQIWTQEARMQVVVPDYDIVKKQNKSHHVPSIQSIFPDKQVPSAAAAMTTNGPKRTLPLFNSASTNTTTNTTTLGFVFFLHVPKTGGTTIRRTLQGQATKHVNYIFVCGRDGYNQNATSVEQYLTSTNNSLQRRKVLFFEVHGLNSPNLLELDKTLRYWKQLGAQNNVPTFFFTVLREPMSYAISYFNFFHVLRKNPKFEMVTATESNFLRLNLYNPQCQFMARGELSLRQARKAQPRSDECHQVLDTLLETMDWVGTTDTLNEETLPLLNHLLFSNSIRTNNNNKNKKSSKTVGLVFQPERVASTLAERTKTIQLDQLSPQALQQVTTMSTLDAEIYSKIKNNYSISKWTNLDL